MPSADVGSPIDIGGRKVGPDQPVYVVAELSSNHGGKIERALELIDRCADAGVDAVKLQTYRADAMTIDADTEWLKVKGGTLWDGASLHALYRESATPWEWTEELLGHADSRGLQLFSTPFDRTAVDFLEQFDPPAYKIASFELVDLELIRYTASTGRPMIMSTGLATVDEIDAAMGVAVEAGAAGVALLRCCSAYPAPPDEMDLRTITDMATRWRVPIGLSDHTTGTVASVTAVALGACIIEKHVTLSREIATPDAPFSLEPDELARLVADVREARATLGGTRYGPAPAELPSLAFRRSLFAARDIPAGHALTEDDVAVVRPGHGLAPRHLAEVLGRRAAVEINRGTPINWEQLT